jgi:ribosomal protein L7Ae-like RNA K-turn-binding protein
VNQDKFYSFIGIIKKSGNLIIGYNNCIFDIKKDKCKLLLLAEDASENTKKKFVNACENRNIPYIIVGSKDKIGMSIGKFPTSVLIIKDEGMAAAVLNILK